MKLYTLILLCAVQGANAMLPIPRNRSYDSLGVKNLQMSFELIRGRVELVKKEVHDKQKRAKLIEKYEQQLEELRVKIRHAYNYVQEID